MSIESQNSPEFFDPSKVKPEVDPTIGHFTHHESEREALRKKGFTDEEIDQREALANDNIARKAA